MLLCVGSFFGPGNPGWSDYKSGRWKITISEGYSHSPCDRVKVPLPVYILGPNEPSELICYPDLVRNVIVYSFQHTIETGRVWACGERDLLGKAGQLHHQGGVEDRLSVRRPGKRSWGSYRLQLQSCKSSSPRGEFRLGGFQVTNS